MEKRNKCVKVAFSTILWAVLAIVLCAAPSLRADVTVVPATEIWDINYPVTEGLRVFGTANLLTGASVSYFIYVEDEGTLNMYSGADVGWYVTAINGSTVNIEGGTVGMWIDVALGAEVTVYGTGFNLEEGVHFIDWGTVTGLYENGDQINLTFDCQPGATITLAAPGSSEPMPIDIDIKPGGNPNNINLKSRGVVAVAALTTNDFNAGEIDPGTVQFAGASPVRCKLCDVDGDGDDDMLFHFKTQDLELDEDSTEATLTCETFGGDKLTGTDTVRIISRFPVHKLRKAKEAKKAKTGRCEGQKPYGYYPEEEETIKRMRQLYGKKPGEGRLSCHRIAQILNKEKRPTRQGGPWQGPQVQQILKLLKLAK